MNHMKPASTVILEHLDPFLRGIHLVPTLQQLLSDVLATLSPYI